MAQDKQGALKDAERETDGLIRALLDMGEALIGSGAEIYRAEDTLRRIAKAYGATDCEVFIITSSIVITLEQAGREQLHKARGPERALPGGVHPSDLHKRAPGKDQCHCKDHGAEAGDAAWICARFLGLYPVL